MKKIGVLSFSDGRKRVHEDLLEYIQKNEKIISSILEKNDEFEVITGKEVIWNGEIAKEQGKYMNDEGVSGVILNVPVFAFPNLVLIAATIANGPFIAVSSANGKYPGLGGVLAASNMLIQNGIDCEKVWGDYKSSLFHNKIITFARASYAVNNLKGQIYGLLGGRSIGMGSGAASPELMYKVFGIDIDHVDQIEIIRRSEKIADTEVEKAFLWLSENIGEIKYDSDKLTKDSLKQQIRSYIAIKEIVNEKKFDFIGVKCHYELSEYSVAQCLAAALMNDSYDWDGKKEPIVFSCEADTDGAITMEIMKLLTQKPIMFADFRHYDNKENVFVFCNCGSMATWYAGRSDNPKENLKNVSLWPLIPKYGGKGCHVQYIAKEGEMTLGRLTHTIDGYKMIIFKGHIKEFPQEKLNETCPNWPHSFVETDCDPIGLIETYINNHVHGVEGDYVNELVKVCQLLNIEYEVII